MSLSTPLLVLIMWMAKPIFISHLKNHPCAIFKFQLNQGDKMIEKRRHALEIWLYQVGGSGVRNMFSRGVVWAPFKASLRDDTCLILQVISDVNLISNYLVRDFIGGPGWGGLFISLYWITPTAMMRNNTGLYLAEAVHTITPIRGTLT